MSDALRETMTTNAGAPQSVTVDGMTVSQHSIADQLAMLKYLDQRSASVNLVATLQNFAVQLQPPGAC